MEKVNKWIEPAEYMREIVVIQIQATYAYVQVLEGVQQY
jgi:hypothetical protein